MFVNPRDPDNKIITGKILEWVLTFDEIPRDARVAAREVTCNDPGCNHTDTYITIEGPNAFKKELMIRKPLVYIRKWDIVL
ncbi:hypothetical protein [Cytophaga hutchinsonii]|jgi:hypothetical protein|nr:hypothetical protein [Cytophaga hutchinsonii]